MRLVSSIQKVWAGPKGVRGQRTRCPAVSQKPEASCAGWISESAVMLVWAVEQTAITATAVEEQFGDGANDADRLVRNRDCCVSRCTLR